eukprot:500285-Pleurochrysis_carterae.AAC.1
MPDPARSIMNAELGLRLKVHEFVIDACDTALEEFEASALGVERDGHDVARVRSPVRAAARGRCVGGVGVSGGALGAVDDGVDRVRRS